MFPGDCGASSFLVARMRGGVIVQLGAVGSIALFLHALGTSRIGLRPERVPKGRELVAVSLPPRTRRHIQPAATGKFKKKQGN